MWMSCNVMIWDLSFSITCCSLYSQNCKLLETSDIMVNRGKLRKATSSASQCVGGKAAFTLTSKLATLVFSIEELAQSRGQGLRKAEKGDVRPVLNSTKIEVLKGKGLNLFFSICWCCFMKFFMIKKVHTCIYYFHYYHFNIF